MAGLEEQLSRESDQSEEGSLTECGDSEPGQGERREGHDGPPVVNSRYSPPLLLVRLQGAVDSRLIGLVSF